MMDTLNLKQRLLLKEIGLVILLIKELKSLLGIFVNQNSFISELYFPLCDKVIDELTELQKQTELLFETAQIYSTRDEMVDGSSQLVASQSSNVEISKVHFSAIAPKNFVKEEYSIINIVMYEDAFREVVDELLKNADTPVKEHPSGTYSVKEGGRIKIHLMSPDLTIEDNVEEQEWHKEYLNFYFAVMVPEDYKKKQILFIATVYIDDVIATRLKFVASCSSTNEKTLKVERYDIKSAFVSYASQDRQRVARIIQGMRKARPDLDIFFDVEALRSGVDWENALYSEIEKRDTLYLCWSKNAKESKYVDTEWRYALLRKGIDCIEPIPLESPINCPPPQELIRKHFNEGLLFIIGASGANEQELDYGDEMELII